MARKMEERPGTRNPSRDQERLLVLAFQAGDSAAYNSIDQSCRPAAERICRRLLVNPADVEEAVQETMVRAYQGLPRFNGSYALTAWIARIATNVCLDTLRARSRRPQSGGPIDPNMERPTDHQPNGDRDPEEILEQVLEAEEVRGVLASLPERHRTALVLREFEGMSHQRIAEMLDTSPQRVKALIHRAKAGFRRAWEDDGPGRLAAFAPLLTPVNWVRRLFGRAPEFDYSVTTSAATTAASPAVQSFVTVASERMSTALAAVVFAGTVSIAVQSAPQPSRAVEEQPIVVEAAAAPVEAPPVEEEKPEKPEKPKAEQEAEPEPEVVPSPDVEPSPAGEELEGVVLEDPEESGKPEIAASPGPETPPHPTGFSYSFASDRTADEPCDCGGSPALSQTGIGVSEEGFSSYSGRLSAAISDASGKNAWPADIDLSTSPDGIDMYLAIRDAYGTSPYDITGTQRAVQREDWGGWTITYEGSFQVRGGPSEHSDAPRRGSFTASLTYSWVEQRLVSAAFSLAEAA